MISTLEELRGRGVFSPLDDRFARSMARLGSLESSFGAVSTGSAATADG